MKRDINDFNAEELRQYAHKYLMVKRVERNIDRLLQLRSDNENDVVIEDYVSSKHTTLVDKRQKLKDRLDQYAKELY